VHRLWQRFAHAIAWTPPTSTEIGVVAKSGLAAGLAWWISGAVTGVSDPVLGSLTAIVVVQVSVRASVFTALQRSAAVVLGVLLALGIGDALALNGFTVGLLVAMSLGVTQLVLHLPAAAARQVPVSALIVLTAVASNQTSSAEHRALNTVIGAAVGIVVSLCLPASRLVDARQTLERLGGGVAGVLEDMGVGLQQPWSSAETEEWRRRARVTRTRLVDQAEDAIGSGREVARWNVRDRRHVAEIGRYEEVLPRLVRAAIGVSVISRGLDDHAHLSGPMTQPMRATGALLHAVAGAVRAVVDDILGTGNRDAVAASLEEVAEKRSRCAQAATRRARLALEEHAAPEHVSEIEWLGYAALLVQVDRIIDDLNAPLPP
jgi:uncharacterized membrane protein YgaE (UPF0421/DUF939 family)